MKFTEDQIDDIVDAWHDGGGHRMSLGEYLGWTDEQYARWVAKPSRIPDVPDDAPCVKDLV